MLERPQSSSDLVIVGVGASSGGLDAFRRLLSSLADNTSCAWVLIQHLDPVHDSSLTSILGTATKLPVIEIKDTMAVSGGRIYVIPPNTQLSLVDNRFKLLPRSLERSQYFPIDIFFKSLAEARKEHAVGIILSGNGSDGTLGLQAIKEVGGTTIAENPLTAKYKEMPSSAIATGKVEFILEIEEIPKILTSISLSSEASSGDSTYQSIVALLFHRFKVDFAHYKENTLKRRILKRMLSHKLKESTEYLNLIESNPSELNALFQDILINVTQFFRDPKVFEALKSEILPAIQKLGQNMPIRIWVPGCSTGEEVYSIAICILEFFGENIYSRSVQIFGTDISARAIEKARLGIYDAKSLSNVSQSRIEHYFLKEKKDFQICKSIRNMCIFAVQNVTGDPPFSKMDLISCRNLLIYLGPELQKKVIPLFHFSLKDSGYLLLGPSEGISNFADLFEPIDKINKFYKKLANSRRQFLEFPLSKTPKAASTVGAIGLGFASGVKASLNERWEAERYILNHYGPPGVMVNRLGEVLHIMGDVSPYLTLNPGAPSFNLAKLSHEVFMPELERLLKAAQTEVTPIFSQPIFLGDKGTQNEIIIEVVAFGGSGPTTENYLVLFKEVKNNWRFKNPAIQLISNPASASSLSVENEADKGLLRQLEMSKITILSQKQKLQTLLASFESTSEELHVSNEELLSSNEELQSSIEELETAKEELQSTNEELTTVNDELQVRNIELHATNSDLMNLMDNVETSVIILDEKLRIRRFTPFADKMLSIMSSDVGRLISDLTLKLDLCDFVSQIQQVLETSKVKEFELRDLDGHWYRLHIQPYHTGENKIEGVILFLYDIHGLKTARDLAESMVQTVREPLLVLDKSLKVVTANRAFYETYQVSKSDTENRLIYDLGNKQWDIPTLRTLLSEILPNKAILENYEVEHEFLEIGKKTMLLNARRILTEKDGLGELILLSIEDISLGKANYRDLYENAPDLMASLDPHATLRTCNQTFANVLGYTKTEMLGKSVFKFIHPDSKTDAVESFQRFLQVGVVYGSKLLFLHKDGSSVLLLHNMTAVRDFKEDILYSRSILRDITEQERLSQELTELQNRYKRAVEAAKDGIWEWFPKTGKSYHSEQWKALLGFKDEEISDDASAFFERVHPNDRPRLETAVHDHLVNKKKFLVEVRLKTKDGVYRWFNSRGQASWDKNGDTVSMVGAITDVTDSKFLAEIESAEVKIQSILGSIPDCLWSGEVSPMGELKFLFFSQAVQKITGLSADSILSRRDQWLDLLGAEDRRLFLSAVLDLKNTKTFCMQYQIHKPDGSIRWIEDRVSLEPGLGSLIRINGVLSDITERKLNEVAIQRSLKEKEILLKEIHHRVKNNLNIVSSLLELQSDSSSEPKVIEIFKESQNRIRAMALIHERIYESSDLTKIDFCSYVEELTGSIWESFGIPSSFHELNCDIEAISFSIDLAIPCSLIINELLTNTLKHGFSEGRKGKIHLSLKQVGPKELQLLVGDNGKGFAPDFDFRTSKTLGLQLVLSLVKQIGGGIELLSPPGVNFSICFHT